MSKYSVEALDCRLRGPRFQATCSGLYPRSLFSSAQKRNSRCILDGVFPEVYNVSFGKDVKPSFLGYWLVNSIQLLFPLPH